MASTTDGSIYTFADGDSDAFAIGTAQSPTGSNPTRPLSQSQTAGESVYGYRSRCAVRFGNGLGKDTSRGFARSMK